MMKLCCVTASHWSRRQKRNRPKLQSAPFGKQQQAWPVSSCQNILDHVNSIFGSTESVSEQFFTDLFAGRMHRQFSGKSSIFRRWLCVIFGVEDGIVLLVCQQAMTPCSLQAVSAMNGILCSHVCETKIDPILYWSETNPTVLLRHDTFFMSRKRWELHWRKALNEWVIFAFSCKHRVCVAAAADRDAVSSPGCWLVASADCFKHPVNAVVAVAVILPDVTPPWESKETPIIWIECLSLFFFSKPIQVWDNIWSTFVTLSQHLAQVVQKIVEMWATLVTMFASLLVASLVYS